MEHKLSEHKLFPLIIDVNRTFFKKKNIKKLKCSRNGSPCVQNGLLLHQNDQFFATKLVVTSVSVKTPIFEKLFFPYVIVFFVPKNFVFVYLFGPLLEACCGQVGTCWGHLGD